MKSLLFKLSFTPLLAAMLFGCGGAPDDDAKLSEIEEDEQIALCEEACADAVSYELTCMEGGVTSTTSSDLGDDEAACVSGCTGVLASVKDSCTLTAGDLRDFYTTTPTCETADANLETAVSLATCASGS